MFFWRISPEERNINWSQLILLTLLSLAIRFACDFAYVGLNGELSVFGLPGALFILPVMLFAASVVARMASQTEKTLLLLITFSAINVSYEVCHFILQRLFHQNLIRAFIPRSRNIPENLMTGWLALSCGIAAVRLTGLQASKKIAAVLLTILFIGAPLSQIYVNRTLWAQPYDENESDGWKNYNILSSEDIFYLQPKLLENELAAVKPGDKAGINLYFVGVAGYSSQDVFMKEVEYVSQQFNKRYSTTDHSVTLINNSKTAAKKPIASTTSLLLSLKQVGATMDTDKDILFLYLTSHGSSDHKFSLDFGSMKFNELNPQRLRKILDESGIKHRVIVVSACYSGGFIDALKNSDTLVITSAAAEKTSFGCSNDADFTYFGKAYFEEALQKTDSFTEAFDLAKPVIAAREKEDDYTPSDPQIFIGDNIKTSLAEFSRQMTLARVAKTAAAFRQAPSASEKEKIHLPAPVATSAPASLPKNNAESNHLQAAQKLVALLQVEAMVLQGVTQCKESVKSRTPESIVKTNPNYFRGITPQSALWPKVSEAYKNYFDETCDYMDSEGYTMAMAQVYSSTLSPQELSNIIEFYSSPLGKKMTTANMAATQAMQNETTAHMTTVSEKANARFIERLSELAALEKRSRDAGQPIQKPWWRFW